MPYLIYLKKIKWFIEWITHGKIKCFIECSVKFR
jgi:hypothetical protein